MAIWQFTVGLVPRAWVEMEGNVPAMLYDADGYYDTSIAWRQNQPKVDLDVLMSQVLPATESRIDEMKFWGDETKSDIRVCYEGNTVESVQVRVDTRVDSIELCLKIVELARALDCCLFFPEARLISIPYEGSGGGFHRARPSRHCCRICICDALCWDGRNWGWSENLAVASSPMPMIS